MTMCRSFYTMATGKVAPKLEAAAFAREKLGPHWSGLIDAASAWRHGVGMNQKARVKGLIRFTIDECARLLGD
jgi:hypothetical protein